MIPTCYPDKDHSNDKYVNSFLYKNNTNAEFRTRKGQSNQKSTHLNQNIASIELTKRV